MADLFAPVDPGAMPRNGGIGIPRRHRNDNRRAYRQHSRFPLW